MTGRREFNPARITAQHRQVLMLLAEGDKDWEIAVQLGLQLRQVHERVKSLRWMLEARNRAHVVARGYQVGLLPAGRVAS
ncbi:hypothetical protein GCM10010172_35290 [Paractinoplanes ferrugineus]|uniref:HTH luxR-type domain-containing protein n=1 Tax=Paractinoplanes ferrugineus TaxID=113564 RepID=A0A919JGG4_9ACTN|nr:LuxR C-terminal-related transcriptional regulator [Actinoplanes ferrugineus]GIE16761.1 hypothetical protein Afe05nite_86010 [Actinoplanes ferrugineus]